jgi:hypothetical protein
MIRPTVDALVDQLPDAVQAGVRGVVAGLSDADAVDFIKAGWPDAQASQADIVKRTQQQRAFREAGHNGGVKTARKRRMGLVEPADPEATLWKPDFKSPVDKTIYRKYGRIPDYYVAVIPAMSGLVRGLALYIVGHADHLGRFCLPRQKVADAIGHGRTETYRAVKLLEAAKLIRVYLRGDRKQSTIWTLPPADGVDVGLARRVLQAARRAASQRIQKAAKP